MNRSSKFRTYMAATAVASVLVAGPSVLGATPASAATQISYCTGTTFGWGNDTSNKQCIKDIQEMLNIYGAGSKLTVDGLWGSATVHSVELFQEDFYLTIDGEVGHATWVALCGATRATGPAVDAGCH